jgi:hypothetical protein
MGSAQSWADIMYPIVRHTRMNDRVDAGLGVKHHRCIWFISNFGDEAVPVWRRTPCLERVRCSICPRCRRRCWVQVFVARALAPESFPARALNQEIEAVRGGRTELRLVRSN